MARARNIKPGLYKNEELAECSIWARFIFPGLWMLADREGRLEDRPKRIRMELLPYDAKDIEGLLVELVNKNFLVRYEVDGERYIQIMNFVKHQNPHHMELPSTFPPPPGTSNKFNHAPIKKEQRERILKRDSHKCTNCGGTKKLQIDHIVSRSRGGTSDDANLMTLCKQCNLKKGSIRSHIDNKSSSNRDQANVPKSNPADSLLLIPDSLIPLKSSTTSSATTPARDPPAETAAPLSPKGNGKPTKAGTWSVELMRLGVGVTSMHPTLLQLIEDGYELPSVIEALQVARQRKPAPEKIPIGYLDPIIRNPPKAPTKSWWASESATLAKGRELGIEARPGEDMEAFRDRIRTRAHA